MYRYAAPLLLTFLCTPSVQASDEIVRNPIFENLAPQAQKLAQELPFALDLPDEPPPPGTCYRDVLEGNVGGPLSREACDNYWWEKVEMPGTVCGNGSQYKFFVSRSLTSKNWLVVFEPGGACWDYPSCAGEAGIMGAANPNGIPDDHMLIWTVHSPLMWRWGKNNPLRNWNMIFVPYCTGDVHTGNRVVTYEDPDGSDPDLTYHHNGYNNVQRVVEWMDDNTARIPKMFVTGCSAGGTGTQVNYYWLRTGLKDVEQAYMLNDSGPIFPNSEWSAPLHETIMESWDLESVLEQLPPEYKILEDFGNINQVMADTFPEDRQAITYFQRDFNYSRYSYERFWNNPSKEEIHQMWADDTELLMAQYDGRDNLGYFIPYYRELNSSHCAIIGYWTGTEIEEQNMRLDGYIGELLNDDIPLPSYIESVQPDEDQPDGGKAKDLLPRKR